MLLLTYSPHYAGEDSQRGLSYRILCAGFIYGTQLVFKLTRTYILPFLPQYLYLFFR